MKNPFVTPKDQVYVSGSQVRLARGLVDWTQAELSANARVHIDLVKRIEAETWVSATVRRRIRRAFEFKKVVFKPDINPYISGE